MFKVVQLKHVAIVPIEFVCYKSHLFVSDHHQPYIVILAPRNPIKYLHYLFSSAMKNKFKNKKSEKCNTSFDTKHKADDRTKVKVTQEGGVRD